MKFTTFQKINLLLASYLIVCFFIEVIVLLIDIYQYLQIEELKAKTEYTWKSIEWAFILLLVLFIIIIPNVFSIIVHDQKSSIKPPINKWSIFIKNSPIYFLVIITLVALVTLALIKDNEVATFLANKIAGNRISNHSKDNLGINLLMFGLFLLFVLPIISFYNWLHYIGVTIYRRLNNK
jgi:hypothetical protein